MIELFDLEENSAEVDRKDIKFSFTAFASLSSKKIEKIKSAISFTVDRMLGWM